MHISKTLWENIKEELIGCNEELIVALDNIPHTHSLPIYIIEYEYGDIVSKPNFGFRYPKSVHGEPLGRKIPFSIVLEKKFEMFVEIQNRQFSYRIYQKGMPLGTARFIKELGNFEPNDIATLSAGARNVFLLPKVSEEAFHNQMCASLKEYIPKPKSLNDHFETFRQIAKASKSRWRAKLICFTKEWEEKTLKINSELFVKYLTKYNNSFDAYWRTSPYYDFTLTYLPINKNEIINNYVYEIIKRLCAIACRQIPAYSPVVNDDFLPYNLIAKAYRDLYKIKTLPFAMEPTLLKNNSDPVYVTFSRNDIPYKPNRLSNGIKLSDDISRFFKLLSETMHKLNIYKKTDFRKYIDNITVTALHNKNTDASKKYKNVLNANTDLFNYDSRFKKIALDLNMDINNYTTNSPFFTGCVGLKNIKW